MNITEFREKYPQYNNVEDQELADRFYGKYYSHVPREEFDRAFLGTTPEPVDNAGPVKKFLTRDIPNIGRTFGARIGAGYQESAGGGIQMAGEGRESVRKATVYDDLDPTKRDDIQAFLKSSVPSDRQEFARIRKEYINAGETPEMAESIALSQVKERAAGAPSVYGTEESNQAIADYGANKAAEGRQLRRHLQETEPLETKGGQLTAGAIESIGQMTPSLLAGAITGNPAVALAGMGGMTAGQVYGQSRSEGLSQEDAMKNALIQGTTESATEIIPLWKLASLFKPGRLGKKAIEYIISEVPSEMIATAIQNSSDVAFSNDPGKRVEEVKNYLSSKEFAQDEVDTVLQTLIQGGLMAGAGGAVSTTSRLTRKPQIDKTKESNLGEVAEATTPKPVDDSGQLGDEIPGAQDYDTVQMGLDEGQLGEVVPAMSSGDNEVSLEILDRRIANLSKIPAKGRSDIQKANLSNYIKQRNQFTLQVETQKSPPKKHPDPARDALLADDDYLSSQEDFGSKTPEIYRQVFGENTTLGAVREAYKGMREAVNSDFRTGFLDRYNPIKKSLGDDAYRSHRLLNNSGNVLVTWLEHGGIKLDGGATKVDGHKKGFLPWFESLGSEDGKKMLAWIAVKRAEQLERQGRENWLTKGRRDELMNWIGKSQDWQALNKKFQAYNKEILDLAEQSGLISKEGREAWESDIYIPFYREDGLYDEDILHPQKSKRHVSAQIKRLKGGEMKINDLLENTMRNWGHLIQESQRNIARKRAVDVGSKLGLIEEVTPSQAMKESKALRRENFVISYADQGEQKYVRVSDPALFNALSEVNLDYLSGPVMRAFGFAKRTLTYGATFGPAFRVANAFRDTLHTAVISESFAPFIDTYRGMIQVMRKSDDYIALMGSGGGFGQGYLNANDPQAMSRQIKKIAKREGEGSVGRIIDTPRKLRDFWEHIGHISEMAARTQLYSNLKKKGTSHEEAAFEAKDILDFGLSGSLPIVRTAISVIPFLNARFQGLDRMYRGAKANPKAFVLKGTLLSLVSIALWSLHKDDERYKELEDWEKWSYHHFWIGDLHYRLPKAFEVGAIFSTLPEVLADLMNETEGMDYFLDFLTHTATQTFAIGAPSLIKPSAEIMANKSFYTGRPIEDLGDLKRPPGLRSEPWTSETLKALGEKYNISPKKMETLLRGHFASFGMFILGVSDIAMEQFSENERPTRKLDQYPLIGRFVREESSRSKYATRVYETFREIDELVATVNHYKNSGDLAMARQVVRTNRETLKYKRFSALVKRRLNIIRKRERDVWFSNLSAQKKREKLDQLAEKKKEVYKKAYEKFDL